MNLRAQPQVRYRQRHLLKPVTTTALTTLLALTLSACGGSSSNDDDDDHDHDHVHAEGGRLIYSLSGSADTLKMFDQTVTSEQFTSTTVATGADAQLVLSNDGVTLAMLNGSDLSIVSSGLEHMHGEDAHTHDVEALTAAPIAGVAQVVATTDHFSVLKNDGTGLLLEAADGEIVSGLNLPNNLVYPALALQGGQFMTFTANSVTPANTDITVVNADGTTGSGGLIWVRPHEGGYFAESMTCADGVEQTAQTDNFTLILCGDGTLRWLISGYVTVDGHPAGVGETLHVTQRYPATETRREGAIGEVTTGSTGFIENITGLTKTNHEHSVIAAWSADQLWLVNAHSDHPHRGDLVSITGENFGDIIAVTTTTEDDAIALLSNSGKLAVSRFDVNDSSNPVATGETEREQLGAAGAVWNTNNSHLLAGAYEFLVVNSATGTLYEVDAHSAEDDYHLHSTTASSNLNNAFSAVFAHAAEEEHADDDHDHDH